MGYSVTPFGATLLIQLRDRANCVNLSSEKLLSTRLARFAVGQKRFITIETVLSSLWTGQFGARSVAKLNPFRSAVEHSNMWTSDDDAADGQSLQIWP